MRFSLASFAFVLVKWSHISPVDTEMRTSLESDWIETATESKQSTLEQWEIKNGYFASASSDDDDDDSVFLLLSTAEDNHDDGDYRFLFFNNSKSILTNRMIIPLERAFVRLSVDIESSLGFCHWKKNHPIDQHRLSRRPKKEEERGGFEGSISSC